VSSVSQRALAWWALFGSLAGCHAPPDISKKPKRACREAEVALEHAVGLHDFTSARSLRAAAYTACGPRAELKALDQRIVDDEAHLRDREAADARREHELDDALRAFFEFVANTRAAPEHASVRPVCDVASPIDETQHDGGTTGSARPAPAPFCLAKRSLGGVYPIEVRYERDDPQVFRFTVTVNGGVNCARVNGSEEQTWRVPQPGGGLVVRARCALGGPLAGLTASVSEGTPSSVHVVSKSYSDRDATAAGVLAPP
jgi:hypothetical protein